MDYKHHISVDSHRHFAKLCVTSTRILVEQGLKLIQEDLPFTEIITHYSPDLTLEDVKVCAAYAMDLMRNEEIHLETHSSASWPIITAFS